MFKVPDKHRITRELGDKMLNFFHLSPKIVNNWVLDNINFGDDKTGWFMLPNPRTGKGLYILCKGTSGQGWEHVSISIPSEKRCPTWEEMSFVKDLFWNHPDDVVIQYHPAKKDYISMHDYCLHLWRKEGVNFETPPSILVGINKKK